MNQLPVSPVEPIYKQTSHLLHLILTIASFGMWGLLVWWPLSIHVNRKNNKKRAQYQHERAVYEQKRWEFEQAQRLRHQPTQYYRPV